MQAATLAPPALDVCNTLPTRTLRVIFLYDSPQAQANVNAALEAPMRKYGSQIRIVSRAWNFDMLARLDLRHASARIASGSDVIIVAARTSEGLPMHVKSWMTTCLRQHSRTLPVLVAAEAGDIRRPGTQPAWSRELKSVAAIWRTSLLCNREFSEKMGGHWSTSPDHGEAGGGAQPALNESVFTHSRTRGGINE